MPDKHSISILIKSFAISRIDFINLINVSTILYMYRGRLQTFFQTVFHFEKQSSWPATTGCLFEPIL